MVNMKKINASSVITEAQRVLKDSTASREELEISLKNTIAACVHYAEQSEKNRKLFSDMLVVFEAARPLVLNLERLRDASRIENE